MRWIVWLYQYCGSIFAGWFPVRFDVATSFRCFILKQNPEDVELPLVVQRTPNDRSLTQSNKLLSCTGWSKILCAPDDYNTESYKKCSKCSPLVSRHLLTRRTVFSKTVFSIARSTFRMYSVMAIFESPIVWALFEYSNRQVHRDGLITCLFTSHSV